MQWKFAGVIETESTVGRRGMNFLHLYTPQYSIYEEIF